MDINSFLNVSDMDGQYYFLIIELFYVHCITVGSGNDMGSKRMEIIWGPNGWR